MDLPPELTLQILSHLDTASLIRFQRTCRSNYDIGGTHSLWKRRRCKRCLHVKAKTATTERLETMWNKDWCLDCILDDHGVPRKCKNLYQDEFQLAAMDFYEILQFIFPALASFSLRNLKNRFRSFIPY